ncbi:DNA-binding FadR family transcriptional regulator [Microbacterium resistens]|uniref:DNA-binding FadR family transcriptional regulator n=1 Tax=Microbacterium resistens TaxID=156977 RepID=A0ABU1SDF1_9MICO|nr:FCD domain-containing protein [Microbacterium resistens]MDR6867626.1 DNA-binding FadR family transcriptional regulator [Microbacterium resistens]
MKQVTRGTLADQAAELLLERIRGGEWALGERLPGETTLAPQLGVGRSTVREAIRQLAGRGVLTSRQGAGVFVTALDIAEDWDTVLRRAGILSVIEARTAIEGEAAALAARRRTPADIRAIRRALTERAGLGTLTTVEELERYVDADTRFHRCIVAAAHNPLLLDLFDGFTPRLRPAMVDMLRLRDRRPAAGAAAGHDVQEDQLAHERLAESIVSRDAAEAARLSREHLDGLAVAIGSGS